MKKIIGTVVFLFIVVVCVLLYLGLSGEQLDETLSQKEPVSQAETQVGEAMAKSPQAVTGEKASLPSSQQRDSEQLRQEAELRFEKLIQIEKELGKPVERGEGLRVQLEVPVSTETEQRE